MTGGEILGLIALVVLVGAGAVLAAAETSLTHMRRARAAVLARGDSEIGNGHEEGDADDRTGLLLQVTMTVTTTTMVMMVVMMIIIMMMMMMTRMTTTMMMMMMM